MRTSLAVQPHLYIGDVTGKPLDYGMVFFGEPNKDPEFYPINIFYDEALTIPAMQPVRSKGGFLNANGDMVEVYAAEQLYSVKVLDAHGVKVFYQPRMSKTNADSTISTRLPYPNAVSRNQADKNAESISFEDFFAGNNPIAVQSAIDTRKTLTLQNKVYDMGNAKYLVFTPENSNSVVNGNGAVLRFNDNGYVGGSRIIVEGSESSMPAIAANVVINTSVVKFSTPHNLKIGDVFAIQSNQLADYSESGATRYIGEILSVSKVVSATEVITRESVTYSYLLSDGVKALRFNCVSNLTIKDLTIEDAGLDPTGAVTENQRGIYLRYTNNVTLDNITTNNVCGQALAARNSIDWTFKNCHLSQPQIDDILTFAQYGIAIADFSRGGRIENVTLKGFKEGISFTETGTGYGLSLDTKISGIFAFDCSRVISMHGTTRYVDVDNVWANNCMRGMNIRCADVKIRGFHSVRPKAIFQGQGSSLFMLSNSVRDLDIANCSIENSFFGIGTEALGTNFAHKNIKIKDCNFKGVSQPVISLDFTSGSTAEATGLVVTNNTFEDCNTTRMLIKGRFKKPVVKDNVYGDATGGSYGLDAAGFNEGIICDNTFGANLIPVRFTDENGLVSLNNWVEGNHWVRPSNCVSGAASTFVAGLKNNRIGNGYQTITTANISGTGSFDAMNGVRYILSVATSGSVKRINNGSMGDLVTIRAQSGSLTLTTDGNIKIPSQMVLDTQSKTITIVKDADGNWYEVSRTA